MNVKSRSDDNGRAKPANWCSPTGPFGLEMAPSRLVGRISGSVFSFAPQLVQGAPGSAQHLVLVLGDVRDEVGAGSKASGSLMSDSSVDGIPQANA